jgi:hypothetical protein
MNVECCLSGPRGGLTHEEEDNVGGNSRELDGTRVNGLHQDLAILVPLVHIPGLTLYHILLQHSHDLHPAPHRIRIACSGPAGTATLRSATCDNQSPGVFWSRIRLFTLGIDMRSNLDTSAVMEGQVDNNHCTHPSTSSGDKRCSVEYKTQPGIKQRCDESRELFLAPTAIEKEEEHAVDTACNQTDILL